MDGILNLSAFGDVIKTPNRVGDDTDSHLSNSKPAAEDSNKYGHIFKTIFYNTAQIKLLHWQAYTYGQHKALDNLFGEYLELSDSLAEVIMGKYGKPVLSDENLTFNITNYTDPEKCDLRPFMDKMYKSYMIDCRSILDENTDSEIINILDEIVALVDQSRYLLSLK
jgi:hypothetical protein